MEIKYVRALSYSQPQGTRLTDSGPHFVTLVYGKYVILRLSHCFNGQPFSFHFFYCDFMGTNCDCPAIAWFLCYEEKPTIAFILLRYAYIILALDGGYMRNSAVSE